MRPKRESSMCCRWLLLACLFSCSLAAQQATAENWPGWRGPRGDGTSLETNVPRRWNGETNENVVWKVPVPGTGHSSPIVWEDRVFVVGCLDETKERVLASLDRK